MGKNFEDLDSAAKAAVSRSMFVIYDKVAEAFVGQVIIDRHPAPVCRLFHQLLADKQTNLAAHPKDYVVSHVGYIEDSGRVWAIDPYIVATGEAWLAAQESNSNG